VAFFHLITHALFKALLFICAGNLIDIHHHSQDLRLIGNIREQIPVISSAITIANLALCGAPFLAGFYSKDLIIETTSILSSNKNIVIFSIFVVATILTTAYSTRFILYTLLLTPTSPSSQYSTENNTQIISVLGLSFIAIAGGAITN
jgi:NADH-ubiquinone oxidoreductase chain 5